MEPGQIKPIQIKHPCTYSDAIIEKLSEIIPKEGIILDPFAGTGKIGILKEKGFRGKIICNEIEPDYHQLCKYPIDEWHIGDAAKMNWAAENQIDQIITSPTYGNRMADAWVPKDQSKRISYTFWMGHPLNDQNTGRMQWGQAYQQKHRDCYWEFYRVLKSGGNLFVNLSNHIRKGQEIDVVGWHLNLLTTEFGFNYCGKIKIETPRMRFGKNHEKRIDHEVLLLLTKPKGGEQLHENNNGNSNL